MKKYLLALATLVIGAVSSNAQLINSGFETWTKNTYTTTTAYDPNNGVGTSGWWDFNILNNSFLGSAPISVTRDSVTVHSGKYSAKVTTVVLGSSWTYVKSYGVPDTMGYIITGNINVVGLSATVKTGIPFTQRISQFQFFYQYMPNGVDSAYCAVSLTRTIGGKRNVLGGGFFYTATAASSWTPGSVTIFWDSAATPDTINIVFSSSGRSKAKPGSILYVDDASVVGINEVSAPAENINVYPNPASTEVNFAITSTEQAARADIFDITGKKMNSYTLNNNLGSFSTSGYANGLYFYQVYSKQGSLMKTGKFSILR